MPNIVYIVLCVQYFNIRKQGSFGPVFSAISDCWIYACTAREHVPCYPWSEQSAIALHIQQWWLGLRSRMKWRCVVGSYMWQC